MDRDRSFPPMIIASIDIGTNTVLLLIAHIADDGTISTLEYEQRTPRLGKGVDKSKNLHPESMSRAIDALREYRSLISKHSPDVTVAFATSAVRDANNRNEFIEMVKKETNLDVEVLSGSDEALWTFRGAVSGLGSTSKTAVIDIGGGSTEITIGHHTTVERQISIDMGSVRLTERFFLHDPPLTNELLDAQKWVSSELTRMTDFSLRDCFVAGVAGTATSLVILRRGLREFSVDAVAGSFLTLPHVKDLYENLHKHSSSEILRLSRVMEGRSDIITAGTLILLEMMRHFDFVVLAVSERGVRYGICLREWERRRNK